MLRNELLEIIANRENSGIEFKRDDIRPEQLAKEVVAMANLLGGRILLGVDDDGTVTGIQRDNTEEWVMNIFKDKVHPMMLPFYEEVQMNDDKRVAIISFPQGVSKPYVVRHNNREEIYIRSGSTSQLATREQQARLFSIGGLLHTEIMPVPGTSISSLDKARLQNYLTDILDDPDLPKTEEQWTQRLVGLGFLDDSPEMKPTCTIAGLVLFGVAPRRFLRQTGLRVVVFDGEKKEYQAKLDQIIDAPLVGRFKKDGVGNKGLVDDGLIEKVASILRPFLEEEGATIDEGMKRAKTLYYPWEAVREIVINALAHRDWTRSVDIEITGYSNRLEVISPGALQNTMTVEKMIAGQRSPRNPLIVDVLRDYGYVDARGMGIRIKVIPLMKGQNQTEPIFEATEDFLKTILYKRKSNRN